MTALGHVHSDLMRAAGGEAAFDQCCHILEGAQHAVAGDGSFAAGAQDGHLLAMAWAPPDVSDDFTRARLRHAPYDGLISARHAARGEIRRELDLRHLVLGDHHEARRVLVEAVDDARPLDATDAGEALAAMGEESIDQG